MSTIEVIKTKDPKTVYMVYVTDNKYSDESKKLIYSPIAAQNGYAITNARITMEINKVGSFEFTIPKTNPEFDNVKSMESCIIVEKVKYVTDDNELFVPSNSISEVWRGRVISRELDFYSNAQIICEGILGSLRDHIIIGGMKYLTDSKRYELGINLFNVLTDLTSYQVGGFGEESTINPKREAYLRLAYIGEDNPLNKNEGAFTVEQFEETDNITCLDALNVLLEKYPIFLRYYDSQNNPLCVEFAPLDKYDYFLSKQKIEFGSNLLDLSQIIDFSSIYTLAWVFGKENKSGVKVNLSSLKGFDDGTYKISGGTEEEVKIIPATASFSEASPDYGPIFHKELVNLYGYIEKVMEFPEVSKPEELRDKAIAQFKKDVNYSVQINLKAIDLSLINVDYDEFKIGDFVQVISRPHGIDTNTICSKIILDLENPANSEYSFGLNFASLTERQAKIDKQNSQLYDAAKNSIYQEKS